MPRGIKGSGAATATAPATNLVRMTVEQVMNAQRSLLSR